jgi:hypothetical protein
MLLEFVGTTSTSQSFQATSWLMRNNITCISCEHHALTSSYVAVETSFSPHHLPFQLGSHRHSCSSTATYRRAPQRSQAAFPLLFPSHREPRRCLCPTLVLTKDRSKIQDSSLANYRARMKTRPRHPVSANGDCAAGPVPLHCQSAHNAR